ncbi:hypothetical protein [Desulfosporosinus sp. SB140]|uniref:hypothetical protein n=1 Tax=Desulfosporosinus paludis TaxID=3115649 RepID=UPI00388E0EC1
MDEFFYASKKSKMHCCHKSDCRHLSNIKKANMTKFKEKKAIKRGYRYCQHCFGTRSEIIRRKKGIKEECKKYNLRFKFSGSVAFINSKISQWYIYLNEDKPLIFHKGLRNKNRITNEFHVQKNGKSFINIKDAINYIARHDRKTHLLGPRNQKEARIMYLLNSIVRNNHVEDNVLGQYWNI